MFVKTVSRLNVTSENICKKSTHFFWLQVGDLNISNTFYEIQNFNGWPVFSVMTHWTLGAFQIGWGFFLLLSFSYWFVFLLKIPKKTIFAKGIQIRVADHILQFLVKSPISLFKVLFLPIWSCSWVSVPVGVSPHGWEFRPRRPGAGPGAAAVAALWQGGRQRAKMSGDSPHGRLKPSSCIWQ